MPQTESGWEFWIDDGGRVRMFTVEEPNFVKAVELALAATKNGSMITYNPAPARVIAMLALLKGEAREWASLNPESGE